MIRRPPRSTLFPYTPLSRSHTGVNPERHPSRAFFARLRGGAQQSIDFFVLHCFSFAEIFASCCFIFCRARNARTLISAALQPVIFRISTTEHPCKYSKSTASRSTGLSAVKRCSTSCREANRRLGRSEEHTSELQSQSNLVC